VDLAEEGQTERTIRFIFIHSRIADRRKTNRKRRAVRCLALRFIVHHHGHGCLPYLHKMCVLTVWDAAEKCNVTQGNARARQGHGKGTARARQGQGTARHGKGTARARQGHGKGTERNGTDFLGGVVMIASDRIRRKNVTYDWKTEIVVYQGILAVAGAGASVLVPAPYWPSYPEMVVLAGANPVIVPTEADTGYLLTASQLFVDGFSVASDTRRAW
jgi:hypothetical protein